MLLQRVRASLSHIQPFLKEANISFNLKWLEPV